MTNFDPTKIEQTKDIQEMIEIGKRIYKHNFLFIHLLPSKIKFKKNSLKI